MNNLPLELASCIDDGGCNALHSFAEDAHDLSNWDTQLTPTPNRRRVRLQSVESHESDSSKAVSLNCSDSGHYSSANVSEVQADTGWQDILRQKDQALFLALQDVRRLRSELERLSKSERWYKQELRTQKHSRLEALEKLYTNERNYMQENQRLQRECLRLYAKCGEVERELEDQREHAMTELRKQQHNNVQWQKEQKAGIDQEFENVQQRALIVDQQQLIDVLRKQKRALLADLKRLSEEKDAKIYELQKTLADLDEENQRITKKCKSLLDERSALVTALTEKASALELSKTAHASLQIMAKETQAHADSQRHELEVKEREILELQRVFQQSLQSEQKADEIHRLSVEFHQQLTQKTTEIAALKNSLNTLQQELVAAEDLHTQNEQQQRELEQLRSLLEDKDFELSKMQNCDANKSAQLEALKAEIDEYQSITRTMEQNHQEKQQNIEQLLSSQETLRRVQLELIALNEKYANMCALCERTKFELEIREIESRKQQYEKQKDTEEIKELREKLAGYLQQTELLSRRINELERELDQKPLEKGDFFLNDKPKQCHSTKNKIIDSSTSKELNQEDEDFRNLDSKLLEMNVYIEKLEAENDALKDYIRNQTTEETTKEFLTEEVECNHFSNEVKQKEDDLTLLNTKLQQTHAFLQQLQNENDVLKALVEEGTNASLELFDSKNALQALLAENQKLKEVLQNTSEELQRKSSTTNIEEFTQLNAKLQESAITLERLSIENRKLNIEIVEITKSEAQNTEINNKLSAALATTKAEVKDLQLKLLKNDAKLYKLEKINNRLDADVKDGEKYLAIKQKNQKLQQELENLHTNQVRLEHALRKKDLEIVTAAELEKENIQLREKLQKIEEKTNEFNIEPVVDVVEHAIVASQENDREQDKLREKVAMLEQQLQQTLNINEQQKTQRIELLNQLLEQQNQKMTQLNSTQSDWEELLKTLNETQALEANTRTELERKRAELEELNELFSEQNNDMEKLRELMLLQEKDSQEEFNKMQQTFQQKIVMVQRQVAESEMKNAEKSKFIEELQLKNIRLTKDIDEDFATEVAENKKELRHLRKQVEKLNDDRSEIASRMQEMEGELIELRRNKREAMVVPQIVFPPDDSDSSIMEISDEHTINNNNNNIITDDHLRILTKVLESEHKRKMARYDLHISALLNNAKSLKRSLAVEEQKVSLMKEQQEQAANDLQEFQLTKRQLLEMRQSFEQAQKTIKMLEQQLVLMRAQYESTDIGKSKRQEPTHEVANLIDDYKKLIQQSAASTNRPRTCEIVGLIQRSNQCVPNLSKLESSVQELHHDIQQFITNQHTQRIGNAYAHQVPSLMDELKAATELA